MCMIAAFSTAFGYVAGAILGGATAIFIVLFLLGLVLTEYPQLYSLRMGKGKDD